MDSQMDSMAGSAVVVYAPASIGNVSVGFDVLGAAVSPVDGTLLGDRVEVKAGSEPFALNTAGRFVSKLPTNPKENIVYDCWVVFGRELKKKGAELKPVEMTLEKKYADRLWPGFQCLFYRSGTGCAKPLPRSATE